MTTDIEVKKVRPLLLWWLDKEKNKNLPAGVAFYDEKFGEYRLKLDIQPETQFYLRPISSADTSIDFRAEVVIKKDGKFFQRKQVGEGHLSKMTNGDIFIELGPYSKTLVVGMNHEF